MVRNPTRLTIKHDTYITRLFRQTDKAMVRSD